jgi:hypothetical protein
VTALVMAAGLTVWLLIPRREAPRPFDRTGDPVAFVQRLAGPVRAGKGESLRAIVASETVYGGETVETGAGGSVSLSTTPGRASFVVAAESRLVLDSAAEVHVTRGRLEALVPDTLVLAISTPQAQIVTRDTGVLVTVAAKGTHVEVSRGEAMVKGVDGKAQRLGRGARMYLAAAPPDPAAAAAR